MPRDDAKITYHAAPGAVQPFWQRIPKFFLFPLHMTLLPILGGLALGTLIIPFLPLPSPLDYLIGFGLIALTAMRHAFMVMEKTSQGFLDPDQFPLDRPRERVNLPWKLLGIAIIWGGIQAVAQGLNDGLGLAVDLFTTFAAPAVVMTLSNTNSGIQALNPLNWLSMMVRVGKPYIALFIFLSALTQGAGHALPILMPIMPRFLALPTIAFTLLYFNLVIFVMMGYALYQFHHELGVDVKVAPTAEAEAESALARIGTAVADGQLEDAINLANQASRDDPENLAVQDALHQLLRWTHQTERVTEHGQRYLNTLLRLKRDDEALALFKRLREGQPDLQPESVETLLRLAQFAARRRDGQFALDLLRGFDSRYPRHPLTPDAYFLTAQILSDHLRKDEMAIQILRALVSHFPQHPKAGEANVLLKTLENLSRTPTSAGNTPTGNGPAA